MEHKRLKIETPVNDISLIPTSASLEVIILLYHSIFCIYIRN